MLYISDFENSISFEKKRVTITDLYCYGRITININCLLENAIHKQCEELGWLEEEKQQELNIEHYFDKLTIFGMDGFAVTDGKVMSCADTQCSECDFNGGCCGQKRFIWLASPYKDSTYKLNQFEYDLLQSLQSYLGTYEFKEVIPLTWMKEKGHFKGVDENETIDEILENCEVIER